MEPVRPLDLPAEMLAAHGAVVVTFNYRLGPLGFFAQPLLIGHNADEAFFYRNDSPRTLTGYRDFVARLIPSKFVPRS